MPKIIKDMTLYNGYYYKIVRNYCDNEYYAKIYDREFNHKQDTFLRIDTETSEIEAKQYIDHVLNV